MKALLQTISLAWLAGAIVIMLMTYGTAWWELYQTKLTSLGVLAFTGLFAPGVALVVIGWGMDPVDRERADR